MSPLRIWIIWAAVLLVFCFAILVYFQNAYQFPVFFIGALLITLAAVAYERGTHPAR